MTTAPKLMYDIESDLVALAESAIRFGSMIFGTQNINTGSNAAILEQLQKFVDNHSSVETLHDDSKMEHSLLNASFVQNGSITEKSACALSESADSINILIDPEPIDSKRNLTLDSDQFTNNELSSEIVSKKKKTLKKK